MLTKYSNGWGHLIMSVMLSGIAVFLLVYPGVDQTAKAMAIALLTGVSGAWLVPSTARQILQQTGQLPADDGSTVQPQTKTT